MSIQKGPVYQEIYRDLKRLLQDGSKKPGDDLPSENVLAAQYGTTRMTVRKSFQLLEKEGLIHSWAGKGYFVSQPTHNAFTLDFPDDEQLDGMYKRVFVEKADEKIQHIFALETGKRVVRICRSIDQDGACCAFDIKYLPYTRGKPMIEQELNYFVPFPDIVSKIVPTFLFYTELEISAVLPPKEVAQVLGCSETEPVLLLRRWFMDQDRHCIGYGERYQQQGTTFGKLTAHSGYQVQRG